MANIKDVAKRAGVSVATVSNAMNDPSKVKDTTRARVLWAAAELNYAHMGDPRARVDAGNGHIIGVITEDLTVFNTPDILHAITKSARERGWGVLIADLALADGGFLNWDDVECATQAKNAVNLLLSKNLSGIIYVACQSREIRHLSDGYSVPFAYAYCYSNDNKAPSVIYDDALAAYQLVKHLIDNGHKTIGILSGPENNTHVRERLHGYQTAMFESGILYNPNIQCRGDWDDPTFGYDSMEAMLEQGVTAVFCMNDVMAGGVFDYALSHGIAIPKDLSVVGFDNQSISTALYPKLTTVALPLREIGAETVAQMDKMLGDKGYVCEPHTVTIPCRPIFRDSVANILKT